MEITKTPTGLVVQIPDDVAERLSLRPGDEVFVLPKFERDEAQSAAKKAAFDDIFKRIREKGPLLPAGYKFKRTDAYDED